MSLNSSNSQLFGYRQSASGTYRPILAIRTLATFQLVVTNVGNNGVGVCNVAPDDVFVPSVLMSVRNGCMCIYPKFSLEAESQHSSCRGDWTHVKDMKNPVEVQSPSGDRLFVVFRVIMSGDHIPFTPLDDVPLDLVHSPDRGLVRSV